RIVDDGVAVEDEIQIERAGGPRKRPLAPARSLDREQRLEQSFWREGRAADELAVQKIGLIARYGHRPGLHEPRQADAVEQPAQAAGRVLEMRLAVAEIAAERDGDGRYSIHREGRTSPRAGSITSARRPSRSVRPASACLKKRSCSTVSPRMTRSMPRWRAWVIASTRGRR